MFFFQVYKALLQKGTALEFAPSFTGDKMLVPLAEICFFFGGDNLDAMSFNVSHFFNWKLTAGT